jgi:predicted metalloprotease with PDZ domain
MSTRLHASLVGIALAVASMAAARPGALRSPTTVTYTLRVDTADLTGFAVEMRIARPPATLRLAMAAHPEYDDHFWRYVEGFRAEAGRAALVVTREDSAVWRLVSTGDTVTVRYRIHLPVQTAALRGAWRPFLTKTGGLVGGPHSFMYIVGVESAPSRVVLDLPAGWAVATSLPSAGDSRTVAAADAKTLVEAPMLVGKLRAWRFAVNDVPHRVFYWALPTAVPFDTATFVGDAERITREAIKLFGKAPWHDYTFLYQDGASGALEHANSVTIGAPSAEIAKDPHAYAAETAHEFFHAWNLMRIRPLGYGELDYRTPMMSKGLWFSEGLSMFYSDLLLRRAGLPRPDSTRAAHVARLVGFYLESPGNALLSAERVSEASYSPVPGTLGDLDGSTHLQGELIGTAMDLVIRDATNGKRSMDDVMRAMMERYSGDRGFTSQDVEQTIATVCSCSVTLFFDAHVRGAGAIDFNLYLKLAGLRTQVTWRPAIERDGTPAADRRVRAWLPAGEHVLKLVVWHPASAWARAGLHTGDQVTSVNGTPVTDVNQFRTMLGGLKVGDTVRVEGARPAGAVRATVVMAPFDRPAVQIVADPNATDKQRAIRAAWEAGRP